MTPEMAAQKVTNYLDVPITEIHVVGGVNPKLPYEYYIELLQAIKAARPQAHIKAFTDGGDRPDRAPRQKVSGRSALRI
jgi:aminodeoxyfutalosine synthase